MFDSIWLVCAAVALLVWRAMPHEAEQDDSPMGYEAAWPANHPNHPNQPE